MNTILACSDETLSIGPESHPFSDWLLTKYSGGTVIETSTIIGIMNIFDRLAADAKEIITRGEIQQWCWERRGKWMEAK